MPNHRGPSLVTRISSFDHPAAKLSEFVDNHPFNAALQLLVVSPDGSDLPQACDVRRPCYASWMSTNSSAAQCNGT